MDIVEIYPNVIRFQPLECSCQHWAEGDYTKVYSDGTKENATLKEYLAFLGFPPVYIAKQPEYPTIDPGDGWPETGI